jgi:rSAM/selenodomain-associated transferase 1
MTKAPLVGISKTRLSPPLTATEAATLSSCFLRDTCDNIAHVSLEGNAAGVAVYTPFGAKELYQQLLPHSFALLGQRGQSFGDRLLHAAEDLLLTGYHSFCLIDSDSPTLPAEFLRAAVSALARPGDRVVLGPAMDGGYYLIGLKKAHPNLFTNIDWSTSKVLTQTIARAREIKLPVKLLPMWFDVDDATALGQLCDELFSSNGKPGPIPYQAHHTRNYLSQLVNADLSQRIRQPVAGFRQINAMGNERCDLATD